LRDVHPDAGADHHRETAWATRQPSHDHDDPPYRQLSTAERPCKPLRRLCEAKTSSRRFVAARGRAIADIVGQTGRPLVGREQQDVDALRDARRRMKEFGDFQDLPLRIGQRREQSSLRRIRRRVRSQRRAVIGDRVIPYRAGSGWTGNTSESRS
jgi:hypothetical protein